MLIDSSQAHPYAKAVFAVAKTKQTIEKWRVLLQGLAVIANDPQVQLLFNNPKINKEQLAEFFIDICFYAAANNALNGLEVEGRDFIKLLAESRRLDIAPNIALAFEHLVAEHQNILPAQIISANSLDASYQQKLTQALAKRFGRSVHLTYSVDRNLMGGLVVRLGDLVIDGSVRDKLIRLKENLIWS